MIQINADNVGEKLVALSPKEDDTSEFSEIFAGKVLLVGEGAGQEGATVHRAIPV